MQYTIVGNVKRPNGNRREDAGVDFFVPNDWNNGKPMKLYLNKQVNIPSNVKVKVPFGTMLKIDNKSGVSTKKGVCVGATVVDTSYRGIVHINLLKAAVGTQDKRDIFGRYYTLIEPGEKIAQGVLIKISTEDWDEVSEKEYNRGPKTKRGEKGFGEGTGVK